MRPFVISTAAQSLAERSLELLATAAAEAALSAALGDLKDEELARLEQERAELSKSLQFYHVGV